MFTLDATTCRLFLAQSDILMKQCYLGFLYDQLFSLRPNFLLFQKPYYLMSITMTSTSTIPMYATEIRETKYFWTLGFSRSKVLS